MVAIPEGLRQVTAEDVVVGAKIKVLHEDDEHHLNGALIEVTVVGKNYEIPIAQQASDVWVWFKIIGPFKLEDNRIEVSDMVHGIWDMQFFVPIDH